MKYLGLVATIIALSVILSYFDSKYEKLSPPGKFNKSFRANFTRNLITLGSITAILALLRIWF